MTSTVLVIVLEQKTAVNAYLIKNSKGEGKKKRKKSLSQAVGMGLGGVLWVYKVGTSHCNANGNQSKT